MSRWPDSPHNCASCSSRREAGLSDLLTRESLQESLSHGLHLWPESGYQILSAKLEKVKIRFEFFIASYQMTQNLNGLLSILFSTF
jgi:hypothetical protein